MGLYGKYSEIHRYNVEIKQVKEWIDKDNPPEVDVIRTMGGNFCKWSEALPLFNELMILRTQNADLKHKISQLEEKTQLDEVPDE